MANVLLLGFGYTGRTWYNELTENGHQVQAIVDPNQKQDFPEVSLYSNLEDVSESGVNWVVDASPSDQHFRHIEWAHSVGFPMIVESPMVSIPEDLYKVLGLYEQSQKLFVSQPRRYNPHISGLHEEIKDQKCIERIHLEYASNVSPRGWKSQLRYPFVEEMLIHLVDTVRALAGNSIFTEIQCITTDNNTISCAGILDGKIPVTMHGSWNHASYRTTDDGFWMVTTNRGNYRFNGEYILGPESTLRPMRVREGISGVISAFQEYLKSDSPHYPASYQDNSESLKQVFDVYMQLGMFNRAET